MLNRSIVSLERKCREFINKEYNIHLDIPVKINNRLSRSLGRFVISRDRTDNRIEFAGYLLKYGTDEQIISVLKHECIHYSLYKLGREYRDGKKDFENELKKHGSDSTNCISIDRTEGGFVLDERLRNDLIASTRATIESVFDKILKEKAVNN